ncbi:MAG TPA: hypothetical protein VGR78_00235 [Verrucomicrobiae bacterium]|nr:hypothetical protein [Verrucomicrobiae bacterium]
MRNDRSVPRRNLRALLAITWPKPDRSLPAILALFLLFSHQPNSSGSGATLYPGSNLDIFYSIGIDGGGTVVLSGRRGNAEGFFELKNGAFIFTQLQPVRQMSDNGAVLSRDGKYLVAFADIGSPVLWERGTNLMSQVLPDSAWDAVYGVSTIAGGPTVMGAVLNGFIESPVLWSPSLGLRDISSVWGVATPIYSMSGDGHMVGGGSRWGEPVITFGIETNCAVLHGQGNDNFDVKGFSPNGRFIVADFARTVFSQSVVWTDLASRLLAQPDDQPARACSAVSDSGFIGGQGRSLTGTNAGDGLAFIYDPRTNHSRWFAEWWAAQPSAPPLPDRITWINDLYEAGGQLYAAIQTTNNLHLLAIVTLGGTAEPTLSIHQSGAGQVQLVWPALGNSAIESSTAVAGGWTQYPTAPVASDTNWVLTVPAVDKVRFFRVRVDP